MHNILIIDDHPVTRYALGALLAREGYLVAGEAAEGRHGLQLAHELKPDLVLVDLGLPGLDGLEVIARLRAHGATPRILVLSSLPAATYARRCLQAGAHGFVSKEADTRDLIAAVQAILCGYCFFPSEALSAATLDPVPDDASLLAQLSNRELAVLKQIAQGASNKTIAEALCLSNKTVSTYKARLLAKLNASTAFELMEFAQRTGVS
ncbi:DNA-binding response regulator [Bordetella genomosp. 5]|uniref:DNA-binding response regulator n=1 Tax=Bordetella genomosp. 5 TaxID=1395608 RepID=A0A261TSN7_9BORD|nr:response regulator transcription factor [Bordetella genomosp. 5]OZI42439.1 DNA-binding response regulator [Bordetella genomosp. 5]OZI52162.1 DNA-binding response regulator [Bordetella genomosp. 5]